MIAVIASMYMEAQLVVSNLESLREHEGIFPHFTGRYKNKNIVVAICRTGKVHMALCAQYLIDHYDVTHMFCTGTSGTLNASLDIGDVVIAKDVVQHDMDVTAFGYEAGLIPDIDILRFSADEKVLSALAGETFDGFSLKSGTIVSGDVLVSSDEKKKWLAQTFGGLCAEMEGGAMAQVAYINKIPFNVIRGISDNANGDALDDFTDNIALSGDNAARVTLKAIDIL